MVGETLTWADMTPSQRWARWALNARDKREFVVGAVIQIAAPFGGAWAGVFYGWTGGAIAMACLGVVLGAHTVWRKRRRPR